MQSKIRRQLAAMKNLDMSGRQDAKYEPTPEEIKEGALLIQTTWSERTRRLRAGVYAPQRVSIPTIYSFRPEPKTYDE